MTNEERPADSPLDLEELAAFMDGRLEKAQHREMEERLARDPAAYEVFSQAMRLQALEAPAGRVVEMPRRRGLEGMRQGLVAALLVVTAGGSLWLSVISASRLPRASELEAGVFAMDWEDSTRTVREPGQMDDGLSNDNRAFRLGIRSVQLEVAVDGDDEELTRLLTEQVRRSRGLSSHAAKKHYQEALDAQKEGRRPGRGIKEGNRMLQKELQTNPRWIYQLSRCFEQARLRFLVQERPNWRCLDELERSVPSEETPRRLLEDVQELRAAEKDSQGLGEAYVRVLRKWSG